jgi:hypothetical protein
MLIRITKQVCITSNFQFLFQNYFIWINKNSIWIKSYNQLSACEQLLSSNLSLSDHKDVF